MRTPFFGSYAQGRSLNLVDNRLINLYPEVVETKDGKDVGAFYGTPGLSTAATVTGDELRALYTVSSSAYAVAGANVYKLTSAYATTSVGTLNTSTGPVGIVDNGNWMLFVDGTDGFVYNVTSATFAQVTSASFPTNPATCCYQDGFALVNDAGTQDFYQCVVNDFNSWTGTNFSSADGQPGPIIRVFDNRREVWVFKETSTEIWVNAGASGFAFQRLSGVFIQKGCAAAYSVARVGQNIVWLGRDENGHGIVYAAIGYQVQRVSTHTIERKIQSYSTISDAIGFAYEDEGHFFYVLTFPTGDETWVYDLTTSVAMGVPIWHQRAYFSNGAFSRHRANCYTFFNGKHLVGDYSLSRIYEMSLDTYTDFGGAKKWLRSWRNFPPAASRPHPVRFHSLRLDIQTGIGVQASTSPTAILRWSDDGGHNFSNEKFSQIGDIGETGFEVKWQRLGQTRKNSGLDRIWEVSGDDNMPTAIIGADVEATKIG